jgi:hypothetical protein
MGRGSRGVSVADLDKDGWLDVFCLNTGLTPDDKNLTAYIYWGSPEGFITHQRTEMPSGGQGLPLIADFNDDGHLDLVYAMNTEGDAQIFWGDGTRNYTPQRRAEVPDSKGTSSSEAADMNNDGHLDLLLMRRGNDVISYVYYGNGKGDFSAERRDEFKPWSTQGATVADVNADGWLDVICGRYTDGGSRATMSVIYFGSSDGLSEQNKQELPTNAGTGSQVSDYNGDGYVDLLFYCHRSEGDVNKPGDYGDHCTDSYLYWGSAQGFSADRKHRIPSQGVHYDGGVDLGQIKNRRLEFDYLSPPHEYGQRKPRRIEWTAQTPHRSKVRMQIRTAASESQLAQAKWAGAKGENSFYDSPGTIKVPPSDTWIQYRAVLVSPNGGVSPALERVAISFEL